MPTRATATATTTATATAERGQDHHLPHLGEIQGKARKLKKKKFKVEQSLITIQERAEQSLNEIKLIIINLLALSHLHFFPKLLLMNIYRMIRLHLKLIEVNIWLVVFLLIG